MGLYKHKPDASVDRYKFWLVACGFTQTFGMDYIETFFPVACLDSICVLLSIAINQLWDLCQLDIKNAFLYDDLAEQVLMEQPLGHVA